MSFNGSRWFSGGTENMISADAAKKIQKVASQTDKCYAHGDYKPPYLEIVAQLDSEKEQIFRAAVFSLYKIAFISKNYRQEILHILQKKAETLQMGSGRYAYVAEKISELNKF